MTERVHLLRPITLPSLAGARAAFPERRGGFVMAASDARGRALTLLGAEPVLALRGWRHPAGARVVLERADGGHEERVVDDLFDVIRALLRERHVPTLPAEAPLPLLAGAVGYLGYECGQLRERLPGRTRPGSGLPDAALFFHDWVLGQDDATGEAWLSVVAGTARDAERTFARVAERVSAATAPQAAVVPVAAAVTTHTTRARYLADIQAAQRHIRAGDAFEICLTHRLDVPFRGAPFALWQALRAANPAPHAAFLDLAEGAVVSASPERFVRLDRARVAESCPIKGTRRRGASAAEDEALAAELQASPKDRAENAMIVDLVRNDLGKVSRFGSVTTPSLLAVETYATVHQLVSTVRGELADGRDAVDLVRACFPPGSMTGAPKIEAMTVLEDLEPTERGVYSGALGWFGDDGTVDLSVVIRTIVIRDGVAMVHVGGAITSDSDPAAEWEETLVKARASLAALGAEVPR